MTTTETFQHRLSRLRINQLGLWLFILSEATIFIALLFARFYLQGFNRPETLNQTTALVITFLLLVSSLTAYRAEAFIAAGDRTGFMRNVLFTVVLGIIFMVGVGIEWAEAFEHFPPQTGIGTIFFSMTGMHAFHVFTGLIMLILLYFKARGGSFSKDDYWGPEAVVKYWHFVDVVWVFFYPAIYLVS